MAIMKKPLVKSQYSKSIAGIMDQLVLVREAREHYTAIAKEYADAENALEEHIINTFSKKDLEGARNKTHQMSIARTSHPVAKDWKKIWLYIQKNKAFDLIQKRLSSTAVRERWKENKAIPGVDKFEKLGLSLTKIVSKKKVTPAATGRKK